MGELRCPIDSGPLFASPLARNGAPSGVSCEGGHSYAVSGRIVDLAPGAEAPGFGRLRAATYDLTFDWVNVRGLFGSSPRHVEALHRLAAQAASERGGMMLDVGCGTSRWALPELAAARYPRYIGVDPSLPMLRLADRTTSRDFREASVMLVHSSAQRLPLADSSVDAAVCSLGLQFVPDHGAALAELRRVLRPGGRLFVVAPTLGLRDRYDRRYQARTRKDFPIDRERWPGQLAASGFQSVFLETEGALLYTQASAA